MTVNPRHNPEKVVIDTDIGDDIDDLLALALALNSPEIELVGVTTVFKNTRLRARIAAKLFRLAGRTGMAIAPGIGKPLNDRALAPFLAGADFNETPCQYTSDMDGELSDSSRSALDLLRETAALYDGALTIIAIGPLTNLAVLLQTDPSVAAQIKRIVLMGGAYFSNQAEYNIQCDPEAARIVFRSGIPIVGVGLDVTLQCRLAETDLARLQEGGSPLTEFLWQTIRLWRGNTANLPYLHDPLAVATVIAPDIVKLEPRAIGVETRGEYSRGMTFNITDSNWWNSVLPPANAQVAREVAAEKFKGFFMERILGGDVKL